ncbi:MAG: DNA-directed RNA polymerase [Candidatus Diapherotrites archaeon]|nr:DNA-directed RNA polymerase [Candidatus Diapherotrites archaeon]
MYQLITVRDTVRVPPKDFGKPMKESSLIALREKYENKYDSDTGIVLAVSKVDEIGDGRIIPGDGASYHDVVFESLVFNPQIHEVITGKVSEITQFGAFVRIGPIDGLVHVSQITDDFMSYNEKTGTLIGKESGKVLKEGDTVRARIVTLSLKPVTNDSKIGLTMRQPGLGKMEWIEKEKTKPKKEPKKTGGKKGARK